MIADIWGRSGSGSLMGMVVVVVVLAVVEVGVDRTRLVRIQNSLFGEKQGRSPQYPMLRTAILPRLVRPKTLRIMV